MSIEQVQNAVVNFTLKQLDAFCKELVEASPESKAKVEELQASYKAKVKAAASPVVQGKGKRKRGGAAAAGQEGGAVVAKRPLSAYNLFMREKMKALTAENPGLSKSDIMKKVAALWKESKPKV